MQPATTAAAPQPGQPPAAAPPQQPIWLIKPGEKTERAERIGEHMSWQLLEEMPEWEPQTDQLLHQLPIVGGAVRKTYRDMVEDRNSSLFVSLANLWCGITTRRRSRSRRGAYREADPLPLADRGVRAHGLRRQRRGHVPARELWARRRHRDRRRLWLPPDGAERRRCVRPRCAAPLPRAAPALGSRWRWLSGAVRGHRARALGQGGAHRRALRRGRHQGR